MLHPLPRPRSKSRFRISSSKATVSLRFLRAQLMKSPLSLTSNKLTNFRNSQEPDQTPQSRRFLRSPPLLTSRHPLRSHASSATTSPLTTMTQKIGKKRPTPSSTPSRSSTAKNRSHHQLQPVNSSKSTTRKTPWMQTTQQSLAPSSKSSNLSHIVARSISKRLSSRFKATLAQMAPLRNKSRPKPTCNPLNSRHR